MLSVTSLAVSIENKKILKGLSLLVKPGETHAIMGPNGSGKSTLSSVLAGQPDYEVTKGVVTLDGQDLLAMPPEKRAACGLFLAFQYPVEIPGLSCMSFLKTALEELRKQRDLPPLSTPDFMKLVKEKARMMKVKDEFLRRSLNEGFSGGEKKRNEILQMALVDPKVAILDETDSGLDIDSLQVVAGGINRMKRKDNAFVIITHYQRLLNYITPDVVHIMYDGRIVQSGDKSLALLLEKRGYQNIIKKSQGHTA